MKDLIFLKRHEIFRKFSDMFFRKYDFFFFNQTSLNHSLTLDCDLSKRGDNSGQPIEVVCFDV